MMNAISPGRFTTFSAMEPGDVFCFRNADNKLQLAMKVQWPLDKQIYVLRFLQGSDGDNSFVLLSRNSNVMTERTLLVLSNLEIAPLDTTDFVGFTELEGRLPKSGWLGWAGEQAVLTFDASSISAGGAQVGTVELSSGRLLDDVPMGGWFRKWRIMARRADEARLIFEMT